MSQEENPRVVRGARHRVSLPSERASQRRALDERLFVRFPALLRLFNETWMRLPLRSRLRRLMLVRLAERGCAAANRRDFDLLLCGFDPALEYSPVREFLALDLDPVYYGHDGSREVWRRMLDAFEDFRLEPEEYLDLGDQLLGTVQVTAHGSGSGVPVNTPLFQVFRFRRGLVIWQQDFGDRPSALEAAGLRD
jgi:SnoaL-like domain